MNNLIHIVHELRLAKGTNRKLKILEAYKDNEMWKKFLYATYNESITYGVSAPHSTNFDECEIDHEMFNILSLLELRKVTGNDAKLAAIVLSDKYGEIPRLILDRSIKANIGTTSINKVYPGLIPVFESMKGKDVPITEYPVYTSIKYDGVKVFAFVNESSIQFKTSSGARFILRSLGKEFDSVPYGVYEGELIHKEGKQIHRSVISGQLNSLLAGTIDDIQDYSYVIYDYIERGEWHYRGAAGQKTFIERQNMLNDAFAVCFQDSAYVKQIKNYYHVYEEEVVDMFNDLTSQGYEGTMSRYGYDPYMWIRTPRLIKKKSIKECVLMCTGAFPHSNPDKGNVGSLRCVGSIRDKEHGVIPIRVNVGSGLSKEDIQQSPDYFIGENIEILYNIVTKTIDGYSLFLPRFKRIQKCNNINNL